MLADAIFPSAFFVTQNGDFMGGHILEFIANLFNY